MTGDRASAQRSPIAGTPRDPTFLRGSFAPAFWRHSFSLEVAGERN